MDEVLYYDKYFLELRGNQIKCSYYKLELPNANCLTLDITLVLCFLLIPNSNNLLIPNYNTVLMPNNNYLLMPNTYYLLMTNYILKYESLCWKPYYLACN